jgi:type II secretion system protein J
VRNGFTLVELLLAVTLTALIAVGSLFFLDGARKLGGRVEFKAELYQKARALLGLIERDLQAAYASGQGLDLGLKGTDSALSDPPSDSIELVAANNRPKSETSKECDITRTIYQIETDRGLTRQKIKEITRTGSVLTNSGDVLAADVVGLDLRYHDGTTWNASWDSAAMGKMPRAIEVTLHLRAVFHQEEEIEKFSSAFWLPVGHTYEAPK